MATVVSLTKQKILELAEEWESVSNSQSQVNALITQLQSLVDSNSQTLTQLQSASIPQLLQQLEEGALRVAELNDQVLPGLMQTLADNALTIQNIESVDIPALQMDLASGIENSLNRPQVYFSDEAPTNPDEEERELQVSDVWYDTNDGHKQYMWNGVMWAVFTVDIPDLSLTVVKFKTSTHMIY